jgi:predicted dinucleotide-binding enzyme
MQNTSPTREVDGIAASVVITGDDRAAKRTVFALARDMRFHPMLFVRLGPMRVLTRD